MKGSKKRQMRQHSFQKENEPISEETYEELLEALTEQFGEENVHRTVEIQRNSVVKTIDNERAARNTLENFDKEEGDRTE